jgi:hypothetical protein
MKKVVKRAFPTMSLDSRVRLSGIAKAEGVPEFMLRNHLKQGQRAFGFVCRLAEAQMKWPIGADWCHYHNFAVQTGISGRINVPSSGQSFPTVIRILTNYGVSFLRSKDWGVGRESPSQEDFVEDLQRADAWLICDIRDLDVDNLIHWHLIDGRTLVDAAKSERLLPQRLSPRQFYQFLKSCHPTRLIWNAKFLKIAS